MKWRHACAQQTKEKDGDNDTEAENKDSDSEDELHKDDISVEDSPVCDTVTDFRHEKMDTSENVLSNRVCNESMPRYTESESACD